MGNNILKPKSNIEKLDHLADTIKYLEDYNVELRKRKDRWIENFVTYGIGVYFLAGTVFYIFRSSENRSNTMYYALYPIVLLLIKELISWIFDVILNNSALKLNCLKVQRNEIMKTVMETEPYKTFKCCLEESEKPSNSSREDKPEPNFPIDDAETIPSKIKGPSLPSVSSLLEKLYEFISGEKSTDRFALICSKCGFHNGVVLKEEYDYVSFPCCSCRFFNPAAKSKPSSPRLEQKSVPMISDMKEEVVRKDVKRGAQDGRHSSRGRKSQKVRKT